MAIKFLNSGISNEKIDRFNDEIKFQQKDCDYKYILKIIQGVYMINLDAFGKNDIRGIYVTKVTEELFCSA